MLNEFKDLPIEIELYTPFGTTTEELSQSYLERLMKQ